MKTPNLVTALSGVALATSGMVFGLCLPSTALTWDWSYSGAGGGSGTFTTKDGTSPYLITDITGESAGFSIVSLFPVNFEGLGNDNLLYPSSPWFTPLDPVLGLAGGVIFSRADLSTIVLLNDEGENVAIVNGEGENISLNDVSVGEDNLRLLRSSRQPILLDVQPSSTSTPEPSSLLSFITLGGLVLGSAVRRARK